MAIAAAFVAPAQAAETELATLAADTPIAAYRGRVVFSEQRGDGLWHLRQWAAGTVRDIAVPAQRRPFDVDAGPDAAGAPVAVYSRCAGDPTERVLFSPLPDLSASTGCAIHEIPLNRGREKRRRPHGSEVLPSIWRGALAFVRHMPRERVGRVIVRPAEGAAFQVAGLSSAPCPMGWCTGPAAPSATAEQLDLGARRPALVWRLDGGQVAGAGPGWEASSVALRPAARPVLGGSGHASGACGASRRAASRRRPPGSRSCRSPRTASTSRSSSGACPATGGRRRPSTTTSAPSRGTARRPASCAPSAGPTQCASCASTRRGSSRAGGGRGRSPASTRRSESRAARTGSVADARSSTRAPSCTAWHASASRARGSTSTATARPHSASFEQDGCVARTSASLRADATRASPSDIVRRGTRSAIADVARGARPGGRFAVVELPARGSRRILHGVASVRIAPRRIVDVRTLTELRGRCTDGIVLADAAPRR